MSDTRVLGRALVDDLQSGVAPPVVSTRIHNALADVVRDVSVATRDARGLTVVALSVGVFQNALLLETFIGRLQVVGVRVLTH